MLVSSHMNKFSSVADYEPLMESLKKGDDGLTEINYMPKMRDLENPNARHGAI